MQQYFKEYSRIGSLAIMRMIFFYKYYGVEHAFAHYTIAVNGTSFVARSPLVFYILPNTPYEVITLQRVCLIVLV